MAVESKNAVWEIVICYTAYNRHCFWNRYAKIGKQQEGHFIQDFIPCNYAEYYIINHYNTIIYHKQLFNCEKT